MSDSQYRKENGVRDSCGRFTEGNPGGPGRPRGSRNKDPLEPLRAYLEALGAPEVLTEHKRQIIERIMEVLLDPKTKPQDVVALARCMMEASRINLLAESKTHRNQIY